jgi:hypothetical protein
MSEARKTAKSAKASAAAPEVGLIPIYLPLLPDDNGVGEVDQRVTVTVNGVNKILVRGQHIKVTVAEYEALHNSGRFDKL